MGRQARSFSLWACLRPALALTLVELALSVLFAYFYLFWYDVPMGVTTVLPGYVFSEVLCDQFSAVR